MGAMEQVKPLTIAEIQKRIDCSDEVRAGMCRELGGISKDAVISNEQAMHLLNPLCMPKGRWTADKAKSALNLYNLIQSGKYLESKAVALSGKADFKPVISGIEGGKADNSRRIPQSGKAENPQDQTGIINALKAELGAALTEVEVLKAEVERLKTQNENLKTVWHNRFGAADLIGLLDMIAMVYTGYMVLGLMGLFIGLVGSIFYFWSLANFRKSLSNEYQILNIGICALIIIFFGFLHYANALKYIEENALANGLLYSSQSLVIWSCVFLSFLSILALLSNWLRQKQ